MCYSPITIKTPQGYKKVPCGRCLECLTKYQNDWSARMYEELKANQGKAVFFTLTYDELHVPKNYLKYGTDEEGNPTYELFRSPADYGYNNCYTDERGRTRVLPSCGRERKHEAVAPYVELQEIGYDVDRILDFNIHRANHKEFIKQVEEIYGNFIRNVQDTIVRTGDMQQGVRSSDNSVYSFDAYDGDDFGDDLPMEEDYLLQSSFNEVLEDDDYAGNIDSPILASRVDARPIMQFNSVRKEDVQKWLKRGRDKLARQGKEFTYFITSEYGPRTLRPHYHGVLFGVTAEEAMCMCKDWQKHYGERISWDNVDLSKGDMSYCAKYCSKSFFEHPLCSRDFFYSRAMKASDGVEVLPFSEYHSKHYERCLELFGIDAPIVDKSFKLISKGLGSKWIDDHSKLFDDFQDPFSLSYDTDTAEAAVSVAREVAPWDDDFTTYINKGYKPDAAGFISIEIPVEDLNKKTLKPKKYEECIEKLFNRYKYFRTYKDKTYAYGVPKYYRTKMFSDGLRCAFANYVQSVNVELYRQKLDQVRAAYPDWKDSEAISFLEAQERGSHYQRARNIYDKLEKRYNKSKV